MAGKVIRHEGGRWILYTSDGSRKLGEFDTEEDAKKRERQIQFFRHQKESGDMDIWETLANAFAEFGTWLKSYKPGMEETGNQFRYRLRDPDDFRDGTLRTMSLPGAAGVQLIVGRLKPENVPEGSSAQSAVAQAVHFSKDNFTEAQAKKWVADHPDMKSLEDEIPSDGTGLGVYKQADGSYRWVGWVSNHFRDRDNPPEILSTKAHQEYVVWADENKTYPELWLWHTPGTKIGKVDMLDFADGFLIASGTFDEDKKDVAEKLGRMTDGLAMSHGFKRLVPTTEKGVTDGYRSFEASIIPKAVPANLWTAFEVVQKEGEMLSDAKKAFLVEVLGEEAVTAIEGQTAEMRKAALESGADFKEVKDGAEDSAALAALVEKLTEPLAAAVAEKLQMPGLSAMVTEIKAKADKVDALEGELTAAKAKIAVLEKTDDEKVAAAMTPKAAQVFAWFDKAASKQAATKLGDGEEDKALKVAGPTAIDQFVSQMTGQ